MAYGDVSRTRSLESIDETLKSIDESLKTLVLMMAPFFKPSVTVQLNTSVEKQ